MIERPEVLQLLARQHWVAGVDQLRGLEVSSSCILRARRRREVTTPIRGTVALAGVELTLLGRALCAQLSAGREAFVSGETAGAIRELRRMGSGTVEVTVKESRRLSPPTWCRIVRTSWLDDDRDVEVRDDGIRLASPLRMLFGLAARFNDHRFARAAEDVWHRGLVTPEQAADYLDEIRRSGRSGVRRMELWLERTAVRPRPAQSGLEQDVLDAIERAGLPTPVRQHPLVLETGETIHLDIAWPDVKLAVEPGHSWWHGGDLGQRRDQARDRGCSALGWLVVRYDEDARRRLTAVGRELATIHRRRASSPES